MADTQTSYPDTVPMPPLSRPDEVAALLVDAVDLHCHSGPAAMPRILDHHEELLDAAAAKFRAVLYKDHFYPGMAHAIILEKLFPELGVQLFSGVALNNASGGINPHAVDHAIKLGGKIVWMPTLSAKNHLDELASGKAKTFPKTSKKMLDAEPLTALDANGNVTDATKKVIDLIAEANIILAGGHLHVSEQHRLFDEAARRALAARHGASTRSRLGAFGRMVDERHRSTRTPERRVPRVPRARRRALGSLPQPR